MSDIAAIRLFWWAPSRSSRLLWGERSRLAAWAKSGLADKSAFSNFGDALAPLIVSAITGRRVVWSSPRKADLLAVGSVLDVSIQRGFRGIAWGTGLRAAASPALRKSAEGCNILAVRGSLSANSLGLGEDFRLGDPALLVRELGVELGRRSGPPLYIPHFSRMWSSETQTIRRQFRTLRPTTSPLRMVHEISNSSLVIASSLHGLIVAHAVGTPAVHLLDGVQEQESDWKYRDYESSLRIEIPRARPRDVLNPIQFSKLEEQARDIQPLIDERVSQLSVELGRALRGVF